MSAKDPQARDFSAKEFEVAMHKLIASDKLRERLFKTLDRKIRTRLEIVTVAEDFAGDDRDDGSSDG